MLNIVTITVLQQPPIFLTTYKESRQKSAPNWSLKSKGILKLCQLILDQGLVHIYLKWRNLSRTGKIGSGKKTKYFFPTGLEVHLEDMF